jgi:dienelactone hydrolase
MSDHVAAVPDLLFADPEAEGRWRARFSAPLATLPESARDAPDRSAYLSNVSGVWQVYAWDRATDTHRQVTDRPNGTYFWPGAALPPDGEHVWWFADTDGDEFGRWMREPFHGGTAEPALPGVPDGYAAGMAMGHSVVAVATSTADGSTIWVSRDRGPARAIYRHHEHAGIGAISRDQEFLAIAHSEHGDSRHPAVRVLRVAGGEAVAERQDKGRGLRPLAFSPVPGDRRLLLVHERRDREELLLWDAATDTEVELVLDLPGEVAASWYPDGSALLVRHTHAAHTTLHRYRLASGEVSTVDTPKGTISDAVARRDDSVEYAWSSAAELPQVRALCPDGTGGVLPLPGVAAVAGSVELTDAWVAGPGGPVPALVARPPGTARPLPTVFDIHGGPHGADEDRFSPTRAAWVDAGFAVVHVNYRGSTGYGTSWRDAIEGRPGFTELEDIAAVHDWAVATGIAQAGRTAFVGYSWGGYLALLALGTQPGRWAAVVAGIPVADYVTAYADEMEQLQAFDRALFGGSPDELPELYRRSSPLTYVDAVAAPVLVLAGVNDPRCPIRQVDNYLAALAAAGKDHAVYRYQAGHSTLVVTETIRQTAAMIDFVRTALALR